MSLLGYRRPAILAQIAHDRHTVIEASAGTGKTHAIEYLVLDLLLRTSASIEEILVVTFTEKATAELRGRIRTLLEDVLSGATGKKGDSQNHTNDDFVAIDDEGRRKLEAALFSFERASISTIHAFCRRILTDLAFETGAAFGLEVADAHRLFHRAFRSTLREVLAVDAAARALLDEWMTDGETARRPNLVESLEDLLREAHFNRYSQSGTSGFNLRAIEQLVEGFDAPLLKKLCNRNRKAPSDVQRAIEGLAAVIGGGASTAKRLSEAFKSFKDDYLSDLADRKLDLNERLLLGRILAGRAACSIDARVSDTFLPLVEERLRSEKRQHSEVDYGDMLEWVWEALEGERGKTLLALLRRRFRYGLVDEFQDTDDLQWKIFRKVFLDSAGTNILYVVGDPKQAIYAFRGADVFTYLDARTEIAEAGGVSIKLVENFRSTSDLIGALNIILDQQASPSVFSGEIKYDNPVRCGLPNLRACDVDGRRVVPVTIFKYHSGTTAASVARIRASVGRRIASEIRKILNEPAGSILVHNDNQSRKVEAKDIYILTRTGTEAIEVGGYLRERGVPFAFYKKDGLFQTSEAGDVLDVLKAIDEPNSQSKRLKAWISPFFALPYRELFGRGEVAEDHPLNQRLYEWKALADQERFGTLFDQLAHRTGLVSRELFLSNSERELTNYLHISEILLEERSKESLSLRELIGRLEAFIAETALPAGLESNIQRIESERSAVQIMSVHMSKGLQADVVFLFGGIVQPTMPPRASVYHDENNQRRLALGKAARAAVKGYLRRELREENERLVYVALTRARAKVYLPLYPDGTTKTPVNGYYAPLNGRLQCVGEDLERDSAFAKWFETVEISQTAYDAEAVSASLAGKLESWSPPVSLQHGPGKLRPEQFFDKLRVTSRAMQTRSYTSLQQRAVERQLANQIELEEFKYDLDPAVEVGDLKGGRRIGIFLHEVIEKLDLTSFAKAPEPGSWRERDDVRQTFLAAMRRHQVNDSRWFERGSEIVFNALTTRIATRSGNFVGPLYKCPNVRELEFVYPIPEHSHPLLESASEGKWTVERGYLKGFVDFVFEDGGLHYFADWKSDSLASYDQTSLGPHVKEHYSLQARIYSVGIVRLLGIRSKTEYDSRFGGLLYLFIRGMTRSGAGRDGVYFQRPEWNEIADYERELIQSLPVLDILS